MPGIKSTGVIARMGWIVAVLLPVLANTNAAIAEQGPTRHEVILKDIEFRPNRIRVRKGDTLHFTNRDPFEHDVFVVRTVNRNIVLVAATTIPAGQSTTIEVNEEGVFDLYCTIHGGMSGKISTTDSFEPSKEEREAYEKAKGTVPRIAHEGEELFWGSAQCHRCHRVGDRGTGERGPDLADIGFRAAVRAEKAGLGNATEYITQSILDPSAVIVEGYSDDMARVYQPPIGLDADSITKVVAYLQSLGGEVDEWAIDIDEKSLTREPTLNPFTHGDAEEGAEIFTAYGCAKCHTVGDMKSTAPGPDLTEIGAFRTWAWIAQSVLDPNAEVGRNWRGVIVDVEGTGKVSGILKKETRDEILVQTTETEIEAIPREKVREVKFSKLSRMPGNYGELLTFQQCADLIAYLRSLKGPGKEE